MQSLNIKENSKIILGVSHLLLDDCVNVKGPRWFRYSLFQTRVCSHVGRRSYVCNK